MWKHKLLFRLDFKLIAVLFLLMGISLAVISSMTFDELEGTFLTPYVKGQIEWFALGWVVFIALATVDYHKLSNVVWPLYFITIFLLLGLYFAAPIQSVHRWYKIPLIGISAQPSEYAKLVLVFALSAFLDRKGREVSSIQTSFQIFLIVAPLFFLILIQPDLGTALVFYPMTLVICYFAEIDKYVLRFIAIFGIVLLLLVTLFFSGILSHDEMRPFFTKFLKEYQYERLNPNTYHQKAAQIAIAIGGFTGSGWHKSEFSSQKWLPASHTDSVVAAFGEEFGLLGLIFLLFLFYVLIYLSLQVANSAKDNFGRLLAVGIAIYLAMHIIVNIGMMCGLLPIAGVPLLMVTYGGSSVLTTMAALGVLQSIYIRRFMF